MITPLNDQGAGTRAPFTRGRFVLDRVPSRALLRISALGLYRAFINGQRVGDDQLTPGWTCYNERLSYQTYDVAPLLKAGENVIDVWLGDGWYRSRMLWEPIAMENVWGDTLGVIAELLDGDRVLLASGPDWTAGFTPVLKNGIYFGEIYDAREEGADATAACGLHPTFDPTVLIAHETNGVKELAALPSLSQVTDEDGRVVHDFGQNCGGYVALEVSGPAGARIIVEHAEVLDQDGRFSNVNMRSAAARIEYTLRGGGVERYRPVFTFQGFRYARVTVEGGAAVRSIVSVPISTATRRVGELTTGHPLVDRLVLNTVWSQRSNFIDVPTDCPQRDERLGWTGDAQVFAPTACWLHDSRGILTKFVRDVVADQRPDGAVPHVTPDPTRGHEDKIPGFYGSTGWGDAIWVIPWTLYQHYGDTALLREVLPAMIRWVDFVWSISDGPLVRPPRGWGERGFSFGDWLQPKGPSDKPLPTISDDAAATIYLHIALKNVAAIAEVAGETAEAKRLAERAAAVKAAFVREFVTEGGRVGGDDQTSYALALLHDLVPEDRRAAAVRNFKAAIQRCGGRIGTGFIGTPALLPALIKAGEWETAEALFLQEGVPGWLYQVKRGATTIWERWDAIQEDGRLFDPHMNSYNHYAYGAVCQWLFESVAGIRPDPQHPAFRHILIEPAILPALAPVKARHESAAGPIAVEWSLENGLVDYRVEIPAGSTATLIPSPRYAGLTVDGQPAAGGTGANVELAAGQHRIRFKLGA